MGGGYVTPWNVLSGLIRKRVDEAHQRAQKQKDEERQTEYKAWEGILLDPNSTTDERQRAQDNLRKLVPKETIPLVEGLHRLMGAIHRNRPKPQPGAQPGAPKSVPGGGSPTGAPSGTGPVAGGGGGALAPTQPSPTMPPAAPQSPQDASTPPDLASTLSSVYARTPEGEGERAGRQALAQEKVAAKGRMDSVNAWKQAALSRGEEVDRNEAMALDVWAITGHPPTGAAFKPKTKFITITDPLDPKALIPAVQDEEGNVFANGQLVEHPQMMPKWKPRKAVMRDAQGRFFSVAVDPSSNQPIPGTEDYQELPPAAYLDKIRTHERMDFDDSGNPHITSLTSHSSINVPSNVRDGTVPAVPPADRKLPPVQKGKEGKEGKGAGAATSDKRTGWTKDTGVLSASGQRAMQATEPVANQAKKLRDLIKQAGLQDNNQPGYLLLPYIAYRLGYESEGALEQEIAGLSLGSVIEAASVLQGTSRSISALRLAMVHTPNAKVDSPKLIYDKLNNDIIPRLDDVMAAAQKYGRKRATAQVPDNIKAPPDKIDPDAAADEWIRTH